MDDIYTLIRAIFDQRQNYLKVLGSKKYDIYNISFIEDYQIYS